jgi:CDP-diglyceride synthetase
MFAVLSVYSMFSDLLFSVFKRKNKIKDYSNIFPGHGGLLDRIDSLAPTLVLYSAIMFIVGVCSTFINHTDTILTPAAAAISGA